MEHSPKDAKEKMVRDIIDDLGLLKISENRTYQCVNDIPSWLYAICDELIRRGWRKQ